MLFGKKKSVAGLDIGSSSIKIVELDGKMNNLSLLGLGFENLCSKVNLLASDMQMSSSN